MPAGINAVLVPRGITAIARRFVKDERAVDDEIRAKYCFDNVKDRVMRREPIRPGKVEMQIVKTFALPADRDD